MLELSIAVLHFGCLDVRLVGEQYPFLVMQLLEDDGVTRAEETVPAARVRPACTDDSCTKPLADRLPGDPVDCWHDDGFWEVCACCHGSLASMASHCAH